MKPEVHYTGSIIISEHPRYDNNDNICFVAHLNKTLNHPKLGVCYNVRTSEIKVFPDPQGTFETLNTKYIRVYTNNDQT